MSNNDDSRNVGLYIPLEITAPRHPKIRKLARRLKISKAAALGHMCTLWAEILSQSPDGYVADSESLEILADWDGNEGEFTDVAVSVGLVDQDGDAYRVHEYYDRLSHLRQVRQKKLTRDRVRKHRERKAQQNSDSQPCNANSVTDALQKVTGVTVHPEQEHKQQHQLPHSIELDPSSDDTTTTESVGVDGDGFVSESIPDRTEVLDAVDEFETATEAHSEPPPTAEPDPTSETPQAPKDPAEKRQWAVGRDLEGLPDAEPLTKLDIDKALRAKKLIRGTVGSHAWGKLGPLHEASPLTAGELRHGLRLASDPNVVAPLSYAAGCIENLRESSAGDVGKVSPIRKPDPEHVYRERCVQAFLQLQRETGFPENIERARYEALNGMPTDGDVCSYRKANGNWDELDAHRMENVRKAMAMVSL